jgi:hypothetical protein
VEVKRCISWAGDDCVEEISKSGGGYCGSGGSNDESKVSSCCTI